MKNIKKKTMPANKNAMTRYKILDDLLSNRYHNYSLDDLTEEVNYRLSEMYPDTNGVVRRTIEKDIFYLEYEGPFLVDIERYTVDAYSKEKQKSYAKQCLRYANPAFSIFKKQMSADEEYLLSEALTLLGQFDGLPNLGDLEALRLGLGVRKPKHQIISLSKNPLEKSNILGELFTAISQRQTINLHYHTFKNKDVQLTVTLFPYMLKEYNRRWFLVAAAESDGKLLTFGLDRIDDVENLPSHKYVDYDGDLNGLYEDIIGVTYKEESPVYKIVLWVSDNSKDYVVTKPLHESQRSVSETKAQELYSQFPTLSGGQFFIIECKENYELIRELTSFGKDLVVLSPKPITDLVERRVSEMFEIYSKLRT